jgi:hypothetical protein
MKIAHGLWHWARGVMASKIPSPASLIIGAGGGRLRFSEKRRQAAAVQDAGARHFVPVESTSAFAPKLPPSPGYGETSWRDTQVVDISSKMAEMRVVTRLISRRLGLKQAFFDPFLTLNHLGFSSLTEKLPDFLQAGPAPIIRAEIMIRIKIKNGKSRCKWLISRIFAQEFCFAPMKSGSETRRLGLTLMG